METISGFHGNHDLLTGLHHQLTSRHPIQEASSGVLLLLLLEVLLLLREEDTQAETSLSQVAAPPVPGNNTGRVPDWQPPSGNE